MRNIFTHIKGDRAIWAITTLLAIFSFLPVYSAASNLAYTGGNSNTFSFFIKHFMHLFLGFAIMYGVHKVPYKYFRGLSMVMIPIVFVLLLVTMLQGTTIEGANASRWIQIPIVNMSFQTSTLAAVVLMVYVARYLSKIKDKQVNFKETILPLWGPVFLILILKKLKYTKKKEEVCFTETPETVISGNASNLLKAWSIWLCWPCLIPEQAYFQFSR